MMVEPSLEATMENDKRRLRFDAADSLTKLIGLNDLDRPSQ
jgi:hypothetical protein